MPRIKKRFRGRSAHRYRSNPLERRYAAAWQARNDPQQGQPVGVLAYMLADDNNRPTDPTDRDHKIAATVIQWLGSPVGQGFVQDVLHGKDR